MHLKWGGPKGSVEGLCFPPHVPPSGEAVSAALSCRQGCGSARSVTLWKRKQNGAVWEQDVLECLRLLVSLKNERNGEPLEASPDGDQQRKAPSASDWPFTRDVRVLHLLRGKRPVMRDCSGFVLTRYHSLYRAPVKQRSPYFATCNYTSHGELCN